MKNLIKFFITATILFTASCTTENLDSSIASEETIEVFFATNLADSSTRAYDDGKHVNKLYYFVCDSDNRILNDLCGTCDEKVDEKFSFSLSLIRCMEYNIYLWAQYEDENGVAAYSIENGVVAIDYTKNIAANNGNLDAFYGSVNITPDKHGKAQNISLTRPFAQLNALTSDGNVLLRNDVERFENVTSTATVKGVYSQFNLINGTVVDTSKQTVTFASDTIPAGKGEVTSNANYTYLSMNYLFVPTTQKCVADVQFTFTATRRTSGAQPIEIKTPEYTSVPLKSNYKTNIIGKLLTDSTEFNIELDGNWANKDEYIIAGDVTLAEDLIASKVIVKKDAVLNLNGHSITSGQIDTPEMTGTDIAAITIDDGATLTIKDEPTTQDEETRNTENEDKSVGTITGTEYGVYVKNGNVVIKGGNITAGTSAVQVNIGTATIEGGEFSCSDDDKRYVVNCIDACWKNGSAKVYIKGGTFHNFDPANNAAEGPGTNFCPKGYSTKTDDDGLTYTIIPPIIINSNTSFENIAEAFSSGKTILLDEDIKIETKNISGTIIFNIPAGTDAHLDLNGKTITIDMGDVCTHYAFYIREGGSLTIDGNGTVEATTPAPIIFCPVGDLVIENGSFIRHIPEGYNGDIAGMFNGTKPAGGWGSTGVTINGGYFDSGYYPSALKNINVEKLISGEETLVETDDDKAKRGKSNDPNPVRKALKSCVNATFNKSNNYFRVYGGTFVGANPAWGDEGCMLPTSPNYLRPWSYYQGAFIVGQTFNENGIVLPEGFAITKGTHEDGRPTYTVTYNK